jgi:hypothetical protein
LSGDSDQFRLIQVAIVGREKIREFATAIPSHGTRVPGPVGETLDSEQPTKPAAASIVTRAASRYRRHSAPAADVGP